MDRMKHLLGKVTNMMSKIPDSIISLLARGIMASIFWKSAMTKIALNDTGLADFSFAQVWNVITLDWTVSSMTYTLFEYDYDLPLLPYEWAAHMAITAELILPMALVLGFFTRYAALAMLGMTLVIQIFVYPHLWNVHGLWAVALLFMISKGGGKISLDNIFCKKYL